MLDNRAYLIVQPILSIRPIDHLNSNKNVRFTIVVVTIIELGKCCACRSSPEIFVGPGFSGKSLQIRPHDRSPTSARSATKRRRSKFILFGGHRNQVLSFGLIYPSIFLAPATAKAPADVQNSNAYPQNIFDCSTNCVGINERPFHRRTLCIGGRFLTNSTNLTGPVSKQPHPIQTNPVSFWPVTASLHRHPCLNTNDFDLRA